MLRYQFLTITHPEGELVDLLRKLKESEKGVFLYQKKLASDYAKNIFASEDHVGCFKTRRTTLSEASVWVAITGDELKVTNITPTAVGALGIVQYNLILNAFFHDFVAKFIDATWEGSICISGELTSLTEVLSKDTYNALVLWESHCNKTSPIAHPDDLKRWVEFVILLHKDNAELTVSDFGQWLSEDRKWPIAFNSQIFDLETNLEYSLVLLNKYDGANV